MTIRVRVRRRVDRDHLQLWYRCPLTRRKITKSAGTLNPRAAERKAAEWEAEIASQTKVGNPSWSLFRQRFEDEYLASKPKNTRTSYTAALNNWEKHVGEVVQMELITPSVISRFASDFAQTVDSMTTVASNLRHLRAAFRWAESMEMVRRAPRVMMPKLNRRRLARSRAITRKEFESMRKAVAQVRPADEVDRWRDLFDLLWLSGLRIGEALELSWDEPPIMVDLDSGPYPRLVVYGEAQKSREDENVVITPEFDAWLQETPESKRGGLVVDLGEFDRSWACHVIADCGEKAGIVTGKHKFASAHDIRRAFGQRWAKVVKPLTLQKMMRHKSITTTLSFYVDMEDEDVGSELWGDASVYSQVHRSKPVARGSRNGHARNSGKNNKPTRRR